MQLHQILHRSNPTDKHIICLLGLPTIDEAVSQAQSELQTALEVSEDEVKAMAELVSNLSAFVERVAELSGLTVTAHLCEYDTQENTEIFLHITSTNFLTPIQLDQQNLTASSCYHALVPVRSEMNALLLKTLFAALKFKNLPIF